MIPWPVVPAGVVVLDSNGVIGGDFWGDLNPNLGEVVGSYIFNAIDVEVDVVVVDVEVELDGDKLVGCVAVEGGIREAKELAFAADKGLVG
ncbi:hypothetical protein MRB53_000759 [Persea americana]|uniref:Uncharacterized protein n=1 Tax=Persea americana TaxID=3435 RepID=A0ACC2MQN4_PERAE|nr:hypothetical protein MRB53_000759 [Persea americana]